MVLSTLPSLQKSLGCFTQANSESLSSHCRDGCPPSREATVTMGKISTDLQWFKNLHSSHIRVSFYLEKYRNNMIWEG